MLAQWSQQGRPAPPSYEAGAGTKAARGKDVAEVLRPGFRFGRCQGCGGGGASVFAGGEVVVSELLHANAVRVTRCG